MAAVGMAVGKATGTVASKTSAHGDEGEVAGAVVERAGGKAGHHGDMAAPAKRGRLQMARNV